MRKLVDSIEKLQWVVNTYVGQPFSFDIETAGLDYREHDMIGLALYFGEDAFYIVLSHTVPEDHAYPRCTFIPSQHFCQTIQPLFNQDVLMIAHNSKFELGFFDHYGISLTGRLADTLLMAQLLDENRENNLKSLAANLLNMEYAKYQTLVEYPGFGKHEILGVPLIRAANYAMKDVEATWKLYQLFAPQLASDHFRGKTLLDVHNDLWVPLTIVLQKMEKRGIAMNMDAVFAAKEKYTAVAKEHEEKVVRAGLQMIADKYRPHKGEPYEIPNIYLKPASDEELEEAYTDDDDQTWVEKGGVKLPVVTYNMIGKTKAYRPRIPVFNTGSPLQLSELVFEYSGVNLPSSIRLKTRKDGVYSADHDNLETLLFYADGDTPEYLQDVLAWRKAEKFVGTYLNRFISDCDPDDHYALHGQFHIAASEAGSGGTATGRLSSSQPNMQNMAARGEIGKETRSMFVARPGYKLLVADLAQAEIRVLAHYSQDEALLQAFKQGQDLHSLTAAMLADQTYEQFLERLEGGDPTAKDERHLGKTVNFSCQYKIGAKKLQRFILVNNKRFFTIEETQSIIDRYDSGYIGATRFKEDVCRFVRANGYVRTISGRRRRLPEAFSSDKWKRMRAERQGINSIIQGSVGDIMGEAMILIQPELEKIDGTLLLQVHDELVSEVPTAFAERGKALIEELMVRDANKILRCQLEAECGIGDNWYEAKA